LFYCAVACRPARGRLLQVRRRWENIGRVMLDLRIKVTVTHDMPFIAKQKPGEP
jgi:hypothetical protein